MADKRPTSVADMTAEQQEAFIEACRRREMYCGGPDYEEPYVEPYCGWRRALVWGGALLFCLACWTGVIWWFVR